MRIKRFALGMLMTNCYVVYSDTKDAIVVDPGGPAAELKDFMENEGLTLRMVLLTHGHVDHLHGLGEIREIASDGVGVHPADSACVTSAKHNLSEKMGDPVAFEPAERMLADGDEIDIGGMKIRVIHTPGHTVGGCCFLITEGEDSLLLSGDTLFAESVGRSDLPGGDEGVLNESLMKLSYLPDSLAVYPGHGPATTIGHEKKRNPFWPR